jgi:hypothetical protein
MKHLITLHDIHSMTSKFTTEDGKDQYILNAYAGTEWKIYEGHTLAEIIRQIEDDDVEIVEWVQVFPHGTKEPA